MTNTHWTALAVALCLWPSGAFAGWHAVQTEKAVDGPPNMPKRELKTDIYFEKDKLRIDQGDKRSMIYDLSGGVLSMVDHSAKEYLSISVEEMGAMQKKIEAQMPPQMLAEMKKRAKAASEANKPKPTGKKDKVGKFSCKVYEMNNPNMKAELCLTPNPGIEMKSFVAAATAFTKRLEKLTGGGMPSAGGIVETAQYGFPVRARRTLKMGQQELKTESVVTSLKAKKIPASKFVIPKTYKKKDIPQPPAMRGPPGGKAPGGVTR